MSKWTDDEIAELKEAYLKPQPNLIALSNKLKKLPSNICRKAKRLGLGTSLHRKKSEEAREKMREKKGGLTKRDEKWLSENFNKYTNEEIAGFLNRSEHFIERQLQRLGIKKNIQERGWKWRGGHPRGFLGKTHSEQAREKMSDRCIKSWKDPKSKFNTEEHRQFLSDHAVQIQKGPAANSRYSRCRSGAREDLDGLFVRSGWEANYARYLKWMKERGEIKEWFYESDTFDFPIKRGTRFYRPDFKVIEINGNIVFHEVKGWMTQKSRTALDRMARYYPDVKIIVIGEKEYRAISKWKALIPGWEA